jgi:8-oxo-dGTP diphosphatase
MKCTRRSYASTLLLVIAMLDLVRSVASFTTLLGPSRGQRLLVVSSQRLCMSTSSTTIKPPVFPRAAVSVIVRSPTSSAVPNHHPSFILVQRGKEPNKGLWSLPGGKLELGETTLEGGQRELEEECVLAPSSLSWYDGGAIAVTDSIHYDHDNDEAPNVLFHYVIAQCFATAPSELPLIPSDDAADAGWFTLNDISEKVKSGATTPGVLQVLQRAEDLYQAGVLTMSSS